MPTDLRSPAGNGKSTVFIVDDHPIVRQGLALFINQEIDLIVCGDADEASAALSLLAKLRPDLAIVDISLNGPDGLDLLKDIRLQQPGMPVLMLSMLDESIYAERALRAGANGYIMKQEATDKVLVAIRRILRGEIYVSERMADRVLHRLVGDHPRVHDSPITGLSDREVEVFRLIGEGHTTKQMAEELHLSSKTIESYQAHIKEKLSLKNSRELVQCAIEWTLRDKPAPPH